MNTIRVSYQQVDSLIKKLHTRLSQSQNSPDLVLCPLSGARYIGVTLQMQYDYNVGYPKIHTYNKDKQQSGGIKFSISPSLGKKIYNSQKIWLWDDIYDSGFTMTLLSSIILAINPQITITKVALYSKQNADDVHIGEITDSWIQFPWES
jgi:hypoxanthine phosphoribosyltransferase